MIIGNNTSIGSGYQRNVGTNSRYNNVRDYSKYLSGKYACLTPGKNTSVSITSGLLRKAMKDDKTGQWLERELSKAPDYIKQAQQSASARGDRLISASIEFGEEYTTMYVCTVTDTPGTDSDIDKWLDRIKESKEEEKHAVKPEEMVTKQYRGKDLDAVMQNMLRDMQTNTDFSKLMGSFNVTA